MLFRNSSFFLYITITLLAACNNLSNGFINLEQIVCTTYPWQDNTVLPGETTLLSLCFNTAMDMPGTQKIVSVQHAGGSVKGDLFWRGNVLFFTPLEPWLPGVRYVLNLDGTLCAKDGREERINRHIAFYALTTEAAPYALSFTPLDGSSVGVNADDGAFIRIVFSAPMDRQSTVDAFYVDGMSEREFFWSADDTVMEIHPKIKLEPWAVYRWNVGTNAKGKNGVPLGREVTGTFVTDRDRALPCVKEVFPLARGDVFSGQWWMSTGAAIEDGLGSGQAIGIEFSKSMDESVLRGIRFDPPLPGRTELWKDNTVVFIPDRDPESQTRYTLYVSAGSKDTGGLAMEKEFFISFIADIPRLTVLTLDAGLKTTPVQNGIYPVYPAQPEGIITLTLRFSHVIDASSQAAAVLALRLEPFFPGTLQPVRFRSARWWYADTLVLQWEGLESGTAAEKHFYRLVLPGGRSGISDGKGSYLKDDTIFYLEAKN